MIYRKDANFPYPVLTNTSNSYDASNFILDVNLQENPPCLLPADCVVRVCSALSVLPPEVPVRAPPAGDQPQLIQGIRSTWIFFYKFTYYFFSIFQSFWRIKI